MNDPIGRACSIRQNRAAVRDETIRDCGTALHCLAIGEQNRRDAGVGGWTEAEIACLLGGHDLPYTLRDEIRAAGKGEK